MPLPGPLSERPFAVAEAYAWGITPNRLRNDDLARPFHGVRSSAEDAGILGRVRAYAARMAANEFFSHSTAALLLGVPLPRRLQDDLRVHVGVIAPDAPPQAAGVVGHCLKAARVRKLDGLAVAAPETTWCQLAPMLSVADLVAAGDFLVTGSGTFHDGAPATTRGELIDELGRHAGSRGVRRARSAMELVRAGAWSRPESHLRVLIVGAGLPEPQLNVPVRLLGGRTVVVDLAYPQWRLGLEYEGDGHRTDRAVWASDVTRREDLADVDWEIIRVGSADLYRRPLELEQRIRRRIRARAREA